MGIRRTRIYGLVITRLSKDLIEGYAHYRFVKMTGPLKKIHWTATYLYSVRKKWVLNFSRADFVNAKACYGREWLDEIRLRIMTILTLFQKYRSPKSRTMKWFG